MALMKYIRIEDLFKPSQKESLLELWELLKDIENNLGINAPSRSISVRLFPKTCTTQEQREPYIQIRSDLLKQLEKVDKVLKISKKHTQKIGYVDITVDKEKFDSLYKKVRRKIHNLKQKETGSQKTKLSGQTIIFDDDKATITIGKKTIFLPPYKNEHYFCQVVFKHDSKEPISWDIIYDKMTGNSIISGGENPRPIRKNWQTVNDTMKRVNNRIKKAVNTNDSLFSWSNKTIIRNY